MALILAIETATRLCSVALGKDGRSIALREDHGERLSHAELVNHFAAEVLKEAGSTLSDVDAFAVGIGPGSYTGLRIGVSAAKGWCFALDRPLIGISTLRTLVEAALDHDIDPKATLWPMVDARRMEVFTQSFDPSGEIRGASTPAILDGIWIEGAGKGAVVFGDGADKAADLWKEYQIRHLEGVRPSAALMIPIAERRFQAKEFDDLAYLVPEYGKPANVTQPRPR
jgi:tRNA threonylcarbamoyladenosine biosynthesis protein TsaB